MAHISLNFGLILIAIIIFSAVKFTKTDPILIPKHYDVKIEFDLYKNIFFGECNVTIQLMSRTKTITIFNSKTFAIIDINLIEVNDNESTIIDLKKYSFINKTDIYLDFTKSVEFLFPGMYILKMIYVRNILDDEDFFGSLHIDKEEEKQKM